MHSTLPARNAHAPVHAHSCNGAETSLPWKLSRTYVGSCASIVQAFVCRSLLPPLLLSRPNPSPDAVRLRNPSKSTLAHDAVAAAACHTHHSIIRVGAGPLQFVYRSQPRRLWPRSSFSTRFSFHHSLRRLSVRHYQSLGS